MNIIWHQSDAASPALAERQAHWLEKSLVYEHERELKHPDQVELPERSGLEIGPQGFRSNHLLQDFGIENNQASDVRPGTRTEVFHPSSCTAVAGCPCAPCSSPDSALSSITTLVSAKCATFCPNARNSASARLRFDARQLESPRRDGRSLNRCSRQIAEVTAGSP